VGKCIYLDKEITRSIQEFTVGDVMQTFVSLLYGRVHSVFKLIGTAGIVPCSKHDVDDLA